MQKIVEAIGISGFLSDFRFNPVKAYFAYHQLLEVIGEHKDCVSWYLCDPSSRQVINIPKRRLPSNKCDTDGSFIFKNARKVPVKYGCSTLITLNTVHGAARAAGAVMHHPPPGDYVDPMDEEDQAKEVWDLTDLSLQTLHGPSALQQLEAICPKAHMTIP